MRTILLGLLVAFFGIVSAPAHAGDRGGNAPALKGQFQNLDQMIEELNLRPYFQKGLRAKRPLKVAVFDNGFKGAESEIGFALPANTQIHAGPVAPPQGEEEVHGFYMAKIFWSLVSLGGKDKRYAPAEFHLYNTFGYSNLESAVNDAISRKIDIVVYSQTWEYGGNFDGQGFINTLVNRAVNNGIFWINNAGNFGDSTFNSKIESGKDDWIKLPGRNSSVEIRCSENPTGKCLFRSVLSWNDFSNDVNKGTAKDLDFVLTDDTLNIVQSSALVQTPDAGDAPGTSKYPREILTAELKPGLYFLRVKKRSNNFTARDRLRLTVSGDFVKMRNFDKEESLLPPADNAGVLSVGAMDSEKSSLSVKLSKPEVYTNSLITLSKQEQFKGNSNSAAMVAAGVTILSTLEGKFTKARLLSRLDNDNGGDQGAGDGLPLEQLGFSPTDNQTCFAQVDGNSEQIPAYIQEMIDQGGTLVNTTAGWKVFFPFDPIELVPGVFRRLPNDILVVSPQGPGIYARSGMWNLPAEFTEIVQTPYNQSICSGSTGSEFPLPTWAKVFRLPRR